MVVSLHVQVVFFFLAVFKILSLTSDILIITYLGVDLFGFILFGTLCVLDFSVCFLPQVREVFSHYFFK